MVIPFLVDSVYLNQNLIPDMIQECLTCDSQEQNQGRNIVMAEIAKTFDTVNRDALWRLLHKFEYPQKVFSIIGLFYISIVASILRRGSASDSFPFEAGLCNDSVVFASYIYYMVQENSEMSVLYVSNLGKITFSIQNT